MLFTGLALGGAGVGIWNMINAMSDSNMAKRKNKLANRIILNAYSALEQNRRACVEQLNTLGMKKLLLLGYSMNRWIASYEKLHSTVGLKPSAGLNELSRLQINTLPFLQLKQQSSIAPAVFMGVTAGTMSGALTAFGAYSAAAAFATASTGTAIATLSGAAATSATLAFFGGGSLAAGGLGMAGGTMVLGCMVAGITLAVTGLIVSAEAKAHLDNARKNFANARLIAEQMGNMSMACYAINCRAFMFSGELDKLNLLFLPLIECMERAIQNHGADYNSFNNAEKYAVAGSETLAEAIKAIIDTPILNYDGSLTVQSAQVQGISVNRERTLENLRRFYETGI